MQITPRFVFLCVAALILGVSLAACSSPTAPQSHTCAPGRTDCTPYNTGKQLP